MLKKTVLLIALTILAISLSGCGKCPEPEVVVETKYIKQSIPKIQEKPNGMKYNMSMVNLNGEDFYFMSLADGNILLSNWETYENWANTNYKILKGLR